MLYIMRHGKTDWNALHKLQGRTDIPLNEEGRLMALKAHEEYKSWNIDVCYCSPLIRAVETAQIVLKNRGIPIITDERLVEMSFRKPEEYIESIGGAETFAELFARTGSFLKEVIEPQLQEGKDVLIVGHGAMNSSIICQVKNKPIEEFWSAGLEQCKILQL